MTVAVSRTLPLDRVSAIKDAVDAAIRQQMPGAEPIVTTDPVALDNETVLDRVMVIARNRALAVHHVTVHDLKDRLAISLDLEVDGKLSLRDAHAWRTGWKARSPPSSAPASKSIPISSRCSRTGPPAARRRRSGSRRSRSRSPNSPPTAAPLRDVHDVRVRETDEGEIVNFHCRVDPHLSVQSVHEKVDAVERALRAALAVDQARDRPRRADA